jgi:ubiquinone/menaquinone biosynthesis C-methylase UbiE
MPTVKENKNLWDHRYNWKDNGEEWSSKWGGSEIQWYGSLLPRVHSFIPAKTILEIAPGFGRWTQYLKKYCDSLYIVDLSEECIKNCKLRFSSSDNIEYFINDGKSLDMIPNNSIDFVFSFDSLVHVEADVIESYMQQLSKKLTKDGVGFIHHSNLGEYYMYFSTVRKLPYRIYQTLSKIHIIETDAWRAISMTAKKFEEITKKTNLNLVSQEMVNWGTKRLTDCISVFTGKDSKWNRNLKYKNKYFMNERDLLAKLAVLYSKNHISINKC